MMKMSPISMGKFAFSLDFCTLTCYNYRSAEERRYCYADQKNVRDAQYLLLLYVRALFRGLLLLCVSEDQRSDVTGTFSWIESGSVLGQSRFF